MHKASAISIAAFVCGALSLAQPAFADTVGPISFETPDYSIGIINGQQGWSATGSAGSGCAVYDEGVASSLGTAGFGAQSFRISNAVTSGCFGDQAFGPALSTPAGESGADNGSYGAATPASRFDTSFDIFAIPGSTGDTLSISPDRGDGSRMSYLRFENPGDGKVHVYFDDVTDSSHATNADTFNEFEIAQLDASVPHHVELTIDFAAGPDNDLVNVSLDGALTFTGTTWEDYYRYDTESNPSSTPDYTRTVRTMLFRAGGSPVSATSGKGYLIDNLSYGSSETPAAPTPASCPAGTARSSSPVETVSVDSHSATPALSGTLVSGQPYLFVSSGTWQNGGINAADTAFASVNGWLTHFAGYNIAPYFLGANEFQLMVDGSFVNWGAYSPAHSYAHLYIGSGAPASLMIFDGDSHGGPGAFNAGWYGDNSGSLSVSIYQCVAPPQVHIFKFVDGAQATAENQTATFPMVTSWVSSTLGTVNDVPFTLSPTPWGPGVAYEASYIGGAVGDDYSTHEVTSGNDVVGASCSDGKPFALVGYTTGDSLAQAQQGTPTTDTPAFTNLQADKYVIVWNKTCPQLGSISGMKYEDKNRNGHKDSTESGLQGWVIRLIDPHGHVIATTTTAADGTYSFANLQPGTYTVRETHQKGWKRWSKNPKPIVLTAGASATDVNFGNAKTRRGEKDDDSRDDDRNDQHGFDYAHEHPDYGQHQD